METVYITAFIPFGNTETFVLEEICSLKSEGHKIVIIPRDPPRDVFHGRAKDLVADAIWLPLCDGRIIAGFLKALVTRPSLWTVIVDIVRSSRSVGIFFKNAAVLPKSVYVASLLKARDVRHIHAHWASTTATMAYIIHRLTGIPFSFTAHRWDIYENNMLKEKIRLAAFARCISEKGRKDVLSIVGDELAGKVRNIHMGVEIHAIKRPVGAMTPFIILTPANLLPVKGHRYMIEACALLKKKKIDFKYMIIGCGQLEQELKQQVTALNLNDCIEFTGRMGHEKLIQMYKDRSAHLVVVPSINTPDGEHEGIPVALMEAMSYGIPVISTDTGSIAELVYDGAGFTVPEQDSSALAAAIELLIKDSDVYAHTAMKGRETVEGKFNQERITKQLMDLFQTPAGKDHRSCDVVSGQSSVEEQRQRSVI